MSTQGRPRIAPLLVLALALLSACSTMGQRRPATAGGSGAGEAAGTAQGVHAAQAAGPREGARRLRAPYPRSRLVAGIRWDFDGMPAERKAHGSDLWPCAASADGNLYCAWGDGGGFDGDDDRVGRVSLGFARIAGVPDGNPRSISGQNVWGSPPYAETAATFGGKVGSLVEMDGVLYAVGGFWTTEDTADPVGKSGRGPRRSVAWSGDHARSWQIAPWTSPTPLGAYLDTGATDSRSAPWVFAYYLRDGDDRHVYLERIRPDSLNVDPRVGTGVEYLSHVNAQGREERWSTRERDARPVFADRNHVEGPCAVFDAGLGRYLLTVGHYASGNDDDSSAGQVGLFEAPNPWGPWSTVGYYEDWGGLAAETRGDFLSLRIPSRWISADGLSLWAVFSGLGSFDSFNLVHGVLELGAR